MPGERTINAALGAERTKMKFLVFGSLLVAMMALDNLDNRPFATRNLIRFVLHLRDLHFNHGH